MNSTAGINKALSQLTQVFTKRIFFVGGMIKSGTTWFERLLDTHPEIVCKGEAHFATQIVSPLAHLVEEYNTEIVTKGGVIAHLKQFGGGTEVLEFDDNDTMVLSAVAVGLMFAKWIPNDHIKCIGDKTPGNIDNMTLLASLFPEARFFNMIRDGRDAAVSAWHFNLKLDIGDTIKKWGSFDKFVGAFAEAWMTGIVNSRNQAKSLGPERYREITYESLLDQPVSVLGGVFNFLDVDSSSTLVENCVSACSFEKLSGGRQRGEENSESFFRKGVSGDWRNHFTPEMEEEFDQKSNGLLGELGYAT